MSNRDQIFERVKAQIAQQTEPLTKAEQAELRAMLNTSVLQKAFKLIQEGSERSQRSIMKLDPTINENFVTQFADLRAKGNTFNFVFGTIFDEAYSGIEDEDEDEDKDQSAKPEPTQEG